MTAGGLARIAALLMLFWGIGLSLGYPTLNRYDPGLTGVADARYYAQLVENGLTEVKDMGHWRYRVLVPALARPVFLASRGHIGSWEPRFFALLAVNALMCAGTAVVIYLLASEALPGNPVSLVAPLLFYANFNTANLYLSGLVDSAELLALALALLAMSKRAWGWLIPIGVIGALGKETVPIFLAASAGGWLIHGIWRERRIAWGPALCAGTAVLAGLATVAALRLALGNSAALPLGVSGQAISWSPIEVMRDIPQYFTKPPFYYTFIWVLPLTALGWTRLPAPLRTSLLTSLGAGLILSAWASVGDNIGRPLFNAGAATLCIAAALGLNRLMGMRT